MSNETVAIEVRLSPDRNGRPLGKPYVDETLRWAEDGLENRAARWTSEDVHKDGGPFARYTLETSDPDGARHWGELLAFYLRQDRFTLERGGLIYDLNVRHDPLARLNPPAKRVPDRVRANVAAISDNANAFGLHGVVILAKPGRAWEVGLSVDKLRNWRQGDIVQLPVRARGEGGWEPDWPRIGAEIPRDLPEPPEAVIAEAFDKA